jgi:hypothetical protein
MKNKTIISRYLACLIGGAIIYAVKGKSAYIAATYDPTGQRGVIGSLTGANVRFASRYSLSYSYSAAYFLGGFFILYYHPN